MSLLKAGPQRWRAAQQWERSVWVRADQKGLQDDWNHWWAKQFDHYAFLPREIDDAIELGCGPFTNIRLILPDRSIGRVVCSDPLIRSYVALRRAWVSKAFRSGRIRIDPHPAEACSFPPASFDVVVMINVLDHVRDARACLRNAVRLVRSGGWFILGQDLSDAEDVRRYPFDLGHPIRLRREDIEPWLEGFSPVLRKDLPRSEGRNPDAHYATLIYSGRLIRPKKGVYSKVTGSGTPNPTRSQREATEATEATEKKGGKYSL